MRTDGEDPTSGEPGRGAAEPYPGILVYLLAAALYIAIGVFVPWVLSWWRGFVFAFVIIWALPALYRLGRHR